MKLSCFIDRGGTFTDCLCVISSSQRTKVFKVLSENPSHYPDSSLECVRLGLEWATNTKIPRGIQLPAEYIEEIRIGTTIATNALLELKGEKFAFITTKGFKDVLEIGSQSRPDIFALDIANPLLLYTHALEIDERVILLPNGQPCVETPLPTEEELTHELGQLLHMGITSVAIALLHSALYPAHEIQLGKICQKLGFTRVSLSHETVPMVRLVLRGNTVCVDAYLTPKIQAFVDSFSNGFTSPVRVLFMKSDGGLEEAYKFTGHRAILSGPAGGVNGFAQTRFKNQPALGFDMGGTSTDVSRFDGELELVFESALPGGIRIQTPQLDIQTVAAGGGSRLFVRQGIFQVGPESAGATPGPVCYLKPGGLLSITDANLVLGRLIPSEFPQIFGPEERSAIDIGASRRAFEALIAEYKLDMTVEECALGFVAVANEQMCRPIREMTLAKGLDPKEHVLASFGGAGGQHCCAIARNLGMKRIRISRFAGILSAVGLGLAEIIHESQEPCRSIVFTRESFAGLESRMEHVFAHNRTLKNAAGKREGFFHLRYRGTETSLPIAYSPHFEEMVAVFEKRHLQLYGFLLGDRELLVDDLRVRVKEASQFQLHQAIEDDTESRNRLTLPNKSSSTLHHIYVTKEFVPCHMYRVQNVLNTRIPGPAMVLQESSTIYVEPHCVAFISSFGDIDIELLDWQQQQPLEKEETKVDDPIQLSLYANRFMSIAEQMGRTLRQTAVSVNIKERLDFSCALFASDGGLVAHAPYIPVHLGAMSTAVRAQIAHWKDDLQPGDVLVSNHPMLAGGSHLPDITVLSPSFHNGKIVFWVANRGHHSDIGGISPGSMPPNSTRLDEEGMAIVSFKLVQNREFKEEEITRMLLQAGTRNLADNVSDLRAQVAANVRGTELVQGLIQERSLARVHTYMHAIRDYCDACVKKLIRKKVSELKQNVLEAHDFMDDGTKIQLRVTLNAQEGTAIFDFEGTGRQVLGNWNCPRAVTYSAVVYCLRCLIGEEIPLNEGVLQSISICIPKFSLLDPADSAAVVGGNVLTSQRLCDVILKCFQACAASQGCMNNLTLGNADFGYYETICGGAGAGPGFHGRSAVHTHMTNTRIGDPEIIENRFPLLVRRFEIRPQSGGGGRFQGGNGCIRELEFRAPMMCSILSERRSLEPFGILGGQSGQRGVNTWFSKQENLVRNVGGKRTWQVQSGDVVRIETPGGGGYGAATSLSKL